MKAMAIDGFGGADRLRLTEMPAPVPGPGEILIRVHATSVNPVDWKIREGLLAEHFPHHFPVIPGWDVAGTVAGEGEDVAGLTLGQRVFAYIRKPEIQYGAYAEFATVRAEHAAPIPDHLSFEEAASLPTVGLTSWQALVETANLSAGQTVLIHAGAGGIGSLAIQIAKARGATVITTARAANHDYVRALGADHAIDYTTQSFAAEVRRLVPDGVDVAYDTVGGPVLDRSFLVTRRGGWLVGIVDVPDQTRAVNLGIQAAYVFCNPSGRGLRALSDLVAQGKLKPPAIEVMPLLQAAEAQTRSQAGHMRGKIVLKVC